MAVTQEVLAPQAPRVGIELPAIRRFELPDMDRHPWIVERLIKTYPHLTQRETIGWLRGMITSSEHMFLYQPNSVALAQVIRIDTLEPMPIIKERFVWLKDKENPEQQAEAAQFYGEFTRWARNKGVDTIVVEENSDVEHDRIKEQLGRLFTRQQVFAKV